ncbi:DNA POLYMERASE III, ALPHA CHAIN POLC-TYPE (POLIII) [Mycoplasmopsis pulmonis]|uniref:DNA polymerase III PolC-type n=1 Tax=Mycoplasmopsis pulmonis (strain UAB CTIP) TaxID=272635 RepID=DPO3_MYCPU|nr:DNA polymerase III subunit alpha [Mycoplasmopsis pulmonis]P47729.2 RecName: Full=DNA polymerase III PolC-type; Short=PolIII [Mycoplasmopsis pulmonis UAB CTIP]MDZ7293695.1 DNA polymerase III subunit alpha [Mycoplasmopsis pulmonis]CAC13848.1 DNA POLYMERASE III, ALPHA CHAIN POLC-TYPE (POLIII) [Mycoplasmopsis pulmonis]VEU68442.1 DNA polymerase III polC-type [Mycoplasmopsis pulmonis]
MQESFLNFCQEINFDIPEYLKNTKIANPYHDEEKSFFSCEIDFLETPKFEDFKSFYLKTKNFLNQLVKEQKLLFKIENIFYEKSEIKKYLDWIAEHFFKNFDFKNTFRIDDLKVNLDGKIFLTAHSKHSFDLYKDFVEFANKKMQSFGFENFLLKLELNQIEITNNQPLVSSINSQVKTQASSENQSFKKSNFYNKKRHIQLSLKELIKTQEMFVSVVGMVFKKEIITTNSKTKIFKISITDFQEATRAQKFSYLEKDQEIFDSIQINDWVNVCGEIQLEKMSLKQFIKIEKIEKIRSPIKDRQDNEKEKRIELSFRSKMSTMDGILSPLDIVKQAKKFNHSSIAILDHNSVQAFPDFHNLTYKDKDFKVIYGMTLSVISKRNKIFVEPLKDKFFDYKILDQEYVVYDIETTGLSPMLNELIQFGASVIKNGRIIETHHFFIKPKSKLDSFTTKLTGITQEHLEKGYELQEALEKISSIFKARIMVAHNAAFDHNFLKQKFIDNNIEFEEMISIDTLNLAKVLNPIYRSYRLGEVASKLSVVYDPSIAHRADYDSSVLTNIFILQMSHLKEKGINLFKELNSLSSEKFYSKMFAKDISIIAKNQAGLKELFKINSDVLTKYYFANPKMFWEDIKRSKNLLIGSGGLNSPLIDKLLFSTQEDVLNEIDKYDYIEIPSPNNFSHFWTTKFSDQQIKIQLQKLIKWAKEKNKIIVAIGEPRYNEKWQKIIHEIYINSTGIENSLHPLFIIKKDMDTFYPEQIYKTTNEMKQEFSFLYDPELIEEIVVKNPNLISSQIEKIQVIKDKLYTPKFDDSHIKLKKLVYENAWKKYGKNLPEIIEQRIEKELTPILNYGFDVIYWISSILVQKSLSDGYLVGSRGSIGSSLVATLSGITEVNPLAPHYICSKCQYFELVKDPMTNSGFDLDDKKCPKCNSFLDKDGQTIPFETFLGFKADKVPDIDLNFSGEYQGKIHDEVKRLFGSKHTFRAGTISTVAEKTAYGYIKKYLETASLDYSDNFVDFLTEKSTGVKRTTGQHPGGIIIIPKEFDVEDFTPVNFPANDTESSWKTTHFDFHAIHDNVLKLDILGHDDPTALKMLEKLTGVNVKDIPKKDEKIISIFTSPKALGISSEEILGEKTGALGIPEFGTNFVRQMLSEAKPKTFADLVSISGLSHGTDVWINNAHYIIQSLGKTLDQVISCRDDIMVDLIKKGVPIDLSFTIMEQVRKGKGLSLEQKRKLIEHGIENWYIESMEKIKYMFPKAHATAYVLMAWRVAFYKVYYPLEYYATYFSTRTEFFDIEIMSKDKLTLESKIKELAYRENLRNDNQLTTKEKNTLPTLYIANEMKARGFNIQNINLKISLANDWIIDKNSKSLIPPFNVIDGLGETLAQKIVDSRNEKEFLSVEDFINRTGINSTLVEKFKSMGIFEQIPETNQIFLI